MGSQSSSSGSVQVSSEQLQQVQSQISSLTQTAQKSGNSEIQQQAETLSKSFSQMTEQSQQS